MQCLHRSYFIILFYFLRGWGGVNSLLKRYMGLYQVAPRPRRKTEKERNERYNISIQQLMQEKQVLVLLCVRTLESLQSHTNYLCSTISSKNLFLKQLSFDVPFEAQNKFYQGNIISLTDYRSMSWGI